MFDRFVGRAATRGWQLAVRLATASSTQAAAKKYALQVGVAVTAIGVRKAADMVEDKIEELEERGSLSPKAASVASGVVRATSAGVSVTAAVVGNAAGSVIGGDELLRLVDAVRDAVRNPASAELENTTDDHHTPELTGNATSDEASVPFSPVDRSVAENSKDAAH